MNPTAERFSPTFLATFLGCRQAAAWDLERRRGVQIERPAGLDEHGALITRLGDEHETRILERLQAEGEVVVIDGARPDTVDERESGTGADVFEKTRRAMESGAPWIHQAALGDGRWYGYADFLRRVERPCERWAWSYEPWDAKLARQPQPKHVLQIAVYAELLDTLQGGVPARMGLLLGTGAPVADAAGDTHVAIGFAVEDFRYYTRRVAERLLAFAAALPDDFGGEPCKACGQCHWSDRCEGMWESLDHLSRVADISREQRRRLVEANVTTLGALADLAARASEDWPPVRLRVETLERLVEQAALQRRTARAKATDASEEDTGDVGRAVPPAWALLPWQPRFGLDRLPPPDHADLFFDFEGDPLEPGGLEYLCGVLARDGVEGPFASGAPVPDRPGYRFLPFWAHARAEERRSFEALVDAFAEHFERHPDAHLYHYAPYEEAAMKRLAAAHGTREREVDELLRANRLVDLYRIVREGVRVGAPSYSIKKLEPLYMDARATDTADGGQSVVMYHAWRATRDPGTLADIEAYNRDDCVSTVLLHDWLLARAEEVERVGVPEEDVAVGADDPASEEETEAERTKREARELRELERADVEIEVTRLERELRDMATGAGAGEDGADPARAEPLGADAAIADPTSPPSDDHRLVDEREREARHLAADLLRFHEREAKPEWWAFFERQGATPEALVEDADCLGGCTMDPTHWGKPDKRSHTYRFRFPAQETKLSKGANPLLQSGSSAGTIVDLDMRAGSVILKRGPSLGEPPERLALMPGGPLDTSSISGAVRRVVRDYAEGGDAYEHLTALLRGAPPRLRERTPGAPVIAPGLLDPAAVLAATIDAVRRLDRSWLCIQGPPGAGKTFTLARVIDALIEDGRRVGVSSNSHAAIDNVLQGVERYRADRVEREGARPFAAYKKISGSDKYASPLGDGAMVESCTGRKTRSGRDWDPEADLFGGTAWWFSAEDGPKVDVMVVDEAGQVSLGHLVGMASAARNVVLVGDPLQLPQPSRGAHPRSSGASCLEHAIGGGMTDHGPADQDPIASERRTSDSAASAAGTGDPAGRRSFERGAAERGIVPPERGVFLGTTWRMHPELTRFVSEAIYAGRLEAEAGCARQRLVLPGASGTHPVLKPAGLAFAELDHDGCTQRSEPEAAEIARLYAELLAARVVDRDGVERAMTSDDVLVVAPYNLQVNLLRERLAPLAGGDGPRVGTVDRFQGQEAEAVIVSMTTSDAESMPRDATFLLSRNRLNVAISRARCLAVIVASSGLLDLDARTVEEMRLVNLLCRARVAAET